MSYIKSEILSTKSETNSKFKFFNVQNVYEEAIYTQEIFGSPPHTTSSTGDR